MIQDSDSVFKLKLVLAGCLGSGLLMVWVGILGFVENRSFYDFFFTLALAWVAWALWVFFMKWHDALAQGVVVSPRRDILAFPLMCVVDGADSGLIGIPLHKLYKRSSAPLSEIIAIDGSSRRTTTARTTSYEGRTATSYSMSSMHSVTATWPTMVATFSFSGNKSKRDQLFNLIAHLNRMS